jgi:hypothetical protein
MKTLLTRLSIVALGLSLACGGDGNNSLAPLTIDPLTVRSKVATVAVAIATAGQGHGFFDNFIACPRRGVIDYRNTARGRNATIVGCDVGDGIVLDGTVEVQWTSNGADRSIITMIDVVGPIHVTLAGAAAGDVDNVVLRGIAFRGAGNSVESVLDRFDFVTARVVVDGQLMPLDGHASVSNVFHPTLTLDAIPNAGESIDALTEADVRRIALSGATLLAGVLFNETLEVARGDHLHTLPCGTTRVTVDKGRNLPRLDNTWANCDLSGLLVSGTFSTEWLELDTTNNRLTMLLSGNTTLGGGVPRVLADRIEWSVSGFSTLPGTMKISGKIVRGTNERAFSYDLLIDD